MSLYSANTRGVDSHRGTSSPGLQSDRRKWAGCSGPQSLSTFLKACSEIPCRGTPHQEKAKEHSDQMQGPTWREGGRGGRKCVGPMELLTIPYSETSKPQNRHQDWGKGVPREQFWRLTAKFDISQTPTRNFHPGRRGLVKVGTILLSSS